MLWGRGGEEVLLDVGGQDATEAFEDVGHSDEAREILAGLKIGTIQRKVRFFFFFRSVRLRGPWPCLWRLWQAEWQDSMNREKQHSNYAYSPVTLCPRPRVPRPLASPRAPALATSASACTLLLYWVQQLPTQPTNTFNSTLKRTRHLFFFVLFLFLDF